eukprot:15478852-Alexandrium_andersonii.AAC.1
MARRPAAAELLQDHAQTIRAAREAGGSETSSAADVRVAGMISELEEIGVGHDAIAVAAVVETIARELVAEWAESNSEMSMAAWAASAITRGE